MATFYIHAEHYETSEKRIFIYDNEFSTLTNQDKTPVDLSMFSDYKETGYTRSKQFSQTSPIGKSSTPHKLKIQLGTKCNYTCEYCSQAAHVDNSIDFTPKNIDSFMEKLRHLNLSDVKTIEFWGGEPFVYWKTIKPLTIKLKEKYPHVGFLIITNGSMFNQEINDFLEEYDFAVGISHDGPGQFQRGPDPFDNPEQMKWIKDLYARRSPKGKISFNAILTAKNNSRLKIYEFFKERFGENVRMGEGYMLYVTHNEGVEHSMYDYQDMIAYRRQSYNEMPLLDRSKVGIVDSFVSGFIKSIVSERSYYTVGQRCGMDREGHLAVDMLGNVITCQNVSGASKSFNGESHTIGNIENIQDVKLNTGTHWSLRKECPECPVVQMCGGMCFLNQGEYWERSCDNSYNDIMPFFMYAFEILTGYIPYYIDGNIPEWRKDILGMDKPDLTRKKQKVIPINIIT